MSLEQGCRERLLQTEDGKQAVTLLDIWEQRLVRTQQWLVEFTGQAAAEYLRLVFVQQVIKQIISDLAANGQTFVIEALRQVLEPIDVQPAPLAQEIDRMRGQLFELEGRVRRQEQEAAEQVEAKNQAYRERNRLVAFLAHLYPSGTRPTEIEGWDPEWHGCVFIDTPEGQMSWHYHEGDGPRFAHLPRYEKEWDWHTTEEKYARLAQLPGPYRLVRVEFLDALAEQGVLT